MAKRASLKLGCLVMESRQVVNCGTKADRVAFQAKQIDLATLQQPRIHGPMGHVATGAAFGPLRRVLKDEWAALFSVALQANGILSITAA